MIYHGRNGELNDGHDLDGFAETVKQTVKDLRARASDFDFIVVTGMSGVLVGAPVSLAVGKPLVVRRKPNDDSHSYVKSINRFAAVGRGLFLDDFVFSGDTEAACERFVMEQGATMPCRYTYQDQTFTAYADADDYNDWSFNDTEGDSE